MNMIMAIVVENTMAAAKVDFGLFNLIMAYVLVSILSYYFILNLLSYDFMVRGSFVATPVQTDQGQKAQAHHTIQGEIS